MSKTLLLTGATDGIGFVAAKMFVEQGHRVLLHGRNEEKLQHVQAQLLDLYSDAKVDTFLADLSDLDQVVAMAKAVRSHYSELDALINNAGVFHANPTQTRQGFDIRFAVNTFAPVVLTEQLMPLLKRKEARVVNLSSAAQASVDIDAMIHHKPLNANAAYAQSKLALTIWSRVNGLAHQSQGPMMVAVNPKSLLGSKMVKEAYGIDGGDIRLGADIICRAALDSEFDNAHGQYYDNDIEAFGPPHPDALNAQTSQAVCQAIENTLRPWLV
ncbi:SDR family NAD(P)-dependent oxidoreductase [Vibrio sp. SM6]|uniref:SDR family NAD(P)-dependent oxidoreductase n=1 Tax=Vibrio agarilyticus TaxID=2726741 RepID=A0A7X8TRB2_9VIBR|nr:SDR family NAD(P)-dependent oxidoreductase [Vibrio agarilyticus]NLS13413.1 SDR family NAD(P)-dependent oxidoreductase [Vibrio agarilyticus]